PVSSPHTIVALAPMLAPRRTRVGTTSHSSDEARGWRSLVNTADGPTNTPSSRTTPRYTDTWFWILQPSPMTTPVSTYTEKPTEQSRPMTLPPRTWLRCQMRVPSPTRASSSTIALGWIIVVTVTAASFLSGWRS